MAGNNFLLWEDEWFIVGTPFNPHIPPSEGLHMVVTPKIEILSAWKDPQLAGRAFRLAAEVCKIAEDAGLAPWFNIQANGNWGLLPGASPFFHIHIYGRNKTDSWGKPIILPEAPKTYNNEPMSESHRKLLSRLFDNALINN